MPVNFTCPHCGSQTVVAEQFAGQTGPCAKCGKSVTIPSRGGPGSFPPPRSGGMSTGAIVATVIGCVVVGVLLCGGVLAALLYPAVQAARESASRGMAMNNARQIGLAMHSYEAANGSLPPQFTIDAEGKPLHSWRVLLLPYLGEDALYAQLRLDEPWDSPHNKQFHRQMPDVFRDPLEVASARGGGSVPLDYNTDFLAIAGPGTVFDLDKKTPLRAITDGTSNTILVAESSKATIHWMEPKDLQFDQMEFQINGPAGNGVNSSHPGGAIVCFADGFVRFMNDSTPPQDVKSMATLGGGEFVVMPP